MIPQAIEDYPDTNAVLVRRHGVYVWGENWEKGWFLVKYDTAKQRLINYTAKSMTECYDYLFEIAVKMKQAGLDPTTIPKDSEYRDLYTM